MRKKPLTNFSGDPFLAFSPSPLVSRPPSECPQPIVYGNTETSQLIPPCTQSPPQPFNLPNYPQNRRYIKQGIGQMNRLADTIDKMATGQKLNHSYSKQNSTPPYRLNTQVSVLNSSHSTLPRLDRTQTDGTEEESRLMYEIRRVQNRIKQLKFQRNETSHHQNNFQMIRPFLQIQNQNMVNLQMMILAQNRGHCCESKSYLRGNRKYENIPYSVRQVEESQADSDHQEDESINPQRYETNMPNISKNPKKVAKKNNRGKPTKKYNLVKLRKFRVAVIAVYFSILFPRYSNKFTIKRFQLHSKSFYNKDEYKPSLVLNSFVSEILGLNSVKIAQFVRASRMDKNQRRVAKTAKLIITEQYEGKKNFEFYIGDVEMFLLEFLKRLQQRIEDGGLQDIQKYIGKGNLPLSFPIDQYHLLDQIYRITYDPRKLYLKLTKQQSKCMIVSAFFVKYLVFNYLFIIKDSVDLKKKLLKENKLNKDQMIEVQLAATEMYFSGILLHQYCMDLIQEQLGSSDGNGNKIDPTNLPIPKKSMVFNHFGDIEKALGADVQNKQLKKNTITSNNENEVEYGPLDIEQHADQPLFLFTYIKNLEHFQNLVKLIKKSSDYETEIKDKIMDITDNIYEKMINHRREDYKRIKQDMLLDEKNILKHKITTSELRMPKRNGEQKQFLKKISKILAENKQNQAEYESQEQEQEEEESEEDDEVEELPPTKKATKKGRTSSQSSVSSRSSKTSKSKVSN